MQMERTAVHAAQLSCRRAGMSRCCAFAALPGGEARGESVGGGIRSGSFAVLALPANEYVVDRARFARRSVSERLARVASPNCCKWAGPVKGTA
jgi:hypothetical protein